MILLVKVMMMVMMMVVVMMMKMMVMVMMTMMMMMMVVYESFLHKMHIILCWKMKNLRVQADSTKNSVAGSVQGKHAPVFSFITQ
jgi:hypothetical protein